MTDGPEFLRDFLAAAAWQNEEDRGLRTFEETLESGLAANLIDLAMEAVPTSETDDCQRHQTAAAALSIAMAQAIAIAGVRCPCGRAGCLAKHINDNADLFAESIRQDITTAVIREVMISGLGPKKDAAQ